MDWSPWPNLQSLPALENSGDRRKKPEGMAIMHPNKLHLFSFGGFSLSGPRFRTSSLLMPPPIHPAAFAGRLASKTMFLIHTKDRSCQEWKLDLWSMIGIHASYSWALYICEDLAILYTTSRCDLWYQVKKNLFTSSISSPAKSRFDFQPVRPRKSILHL